MPLKSGKRPTGRSPHTHTYVYGGITAPGDGAFGEAHNTPILACSNVKVKNSFEITPFFEGGVPIAPNYNMVQQIYPYHLSGRLQPVSDRYVLRGGSRVT